VTVAIVGVGETEIRWQDPRSVRELVTDAVRRALDDAGLSGADVDGVATEAYAMATDAPADEIAFAIGMTDRGFSAHTSLAGAGTVGSIQLARAAIESGLASVVISYYGISLSTTAGGVYAVHAHEPAKAALEMPFGFYGQPVYFAAIAQRYAYEYGLPPEELGSIAVAARAFAERTPGALRREPLAIDDYLANAVVADPLRKLDCCLMNDGAAAFVLTGLERARDLRQPPVVVAGTGFGARPLTQATYFSQNPDYLTLPSAISGPRAFADAGLTPADVDVAELYDCFSVSTILQLEDLGFVPRGEGARFAASGAIGPKGTLPVNTNGGLLSHSYTVGAGHVVEAVRQLRGARGDAQVDDAEVAAVTGLGAMDHATAILTKDR
jgi:acetyl-CoA acetyltransferase